MEEVTKSAAEREKEMKIQQEQAMNSGGWNNKVSPTQVELQSERVTAGSTCLALLLEFAAS